MVGQTVEDYGLNRQDVLNAISDLSKILEIADDSGDSGSSSSSMGNGQSNSQQNNQQNNQQSSQQSNDNKSQSGSQSSSSGGSSSDSKGVDDTTKGSDTQGGKSGKQGEDSQSGKDGSNNFPSDIMQKLQDLMNQMNGNGGSQQGEQDGSQDGSSGQSEQGDSSQGGQNSDSSKSQGQSSEAGDLGSDSESSDSASGSQSGNGGSSGSQGDASEDFDEEDAWDDDGDNFDNRSDDPVNNALDLSTEDASQPKSKSYGRESGRGVNGVRSVTFRGQTFDLKEVEKSMDIYHDSTLDEIQESSYENAKNLENELAAAVEHDMNVAEGAVLAEEYNKEDLKRRNNVQGEGIIQPYKTGTNWVSLLQDALQQVPYFKKTYGVPDVAREYSFASANGGKKMFARGRIKQKKKLSLKIEVFIDSSGSVGDADLEEFFCTLQEIYNSCGGESLGVKFYMYFWDTSVLTAINATTTEELVTARANVPSVYGGTDANCVFRFKEINDGLEPFDKGHTGVYLLDHMDSASYDAYEEMCDERSVANTTLMTMILTDGYFSSINNKYKYTYEDTTVWLITSSGASLEDCERKNMFGTICHL